MKNFKVKLKMKNSVMQAALQNFSFSIFIYLHARM